MPTADGFYTGTTGNGFPVGGSILSFTRCLRRVDVNNFEGSALYDYVVWTLQEAMKAYYTIHKIALENMQVYDGASFVPIAEVKNGDDVAYNPYSDNSDYSKVQPKYRACKEDSPKGYIDGNSSAEAWFSVGEGTPGLPFSDIAKLYDGDINDEANFLGYGWVPLGDANSRRYMVEIVTEGNLFTTGSECYLSSTLRFAPPFGSVVSYPTFGGIDFIKVLVPSIDPSLPQVDITDVEFYD